MSQVSYKIGQRFSHSCGTFILAKTGRSKCGLINLESGNRWRKSVKVERISRITLQEFDKITNCVEKFKLIVDNDNLIKSLFDEFIGDNEIVFQERENLKSFNNEKYKLIIFCDKYYLDNEEILEYEICRGEYNEMNFLIDNVTYK